MDDFDSYLAALPPDRREKAMKALEHSWSFCTFETLYVPHPREKENLFHVVFGRDRYVVDSNVNWKAEAAKPENCNKAFILSRPLADETPTTRGLFFSNVRYENNNIFLIGTDYLAPEPKGLILERVDGPFLHTFTEEGLANSSGESEQKRREFMQRQKQEILGRLGVRSVLDLPSHTEMSHAKTLLQTYITANAPKCKLLLPNATEVSYACYALLLTEKLAERNKFAKDDDVNIFNDTQILLTALLMDAHLLTEDRGLRRLGRYANIASFSTVPTDTRT